ncbi:MAG: hypothetical protein FWF82_05420 [Oscillospiraceae bacterium]|nr:hypothetical protein [Oscillospiraceae bacterium]
MSKKDKQLQNIRNNPKNVRFEDLQGVMLNLGFIETVPSGGSSHYTYHKGIYTITIPKNKPLNKIYVKRAVKIIDELMKQGDES